MKMLERSSLEQIQGGGCDSVNVCNVVGGVVSTLGCLTSLCASLTIGISASTGGCGCGGTSLGIGIGLHL
ncbi:MAG: hypothetical protein J0H07_08940 [Sphingobacteriales bacterium]|nr:hypothetical protein [Sphingobacteriales bacterium]